MTRAYLCVDGPLKGQVRAVADGLESFDALLWPGPPQVLTHQGARPRNEAAAVLRYVLQPDSTHGPVWVCGIDTAANLRDDSGNLLEDCP